MKDIILTRRSIRAYKPTSIKEEDVEYLLRAAMSAPSAKNINPWYFIVIRDRKILDEIPKIHEYSKMLYEAPLAICVCGNSGADKFGGYWIQDCSAASENILLAANSIGLGSVWLGVFPREERIEKLKKLLNIPDGITPLSILAIGYPNEEKPPSERYKKDRVHFDKW
ncbi:MAG TPA: nitroreductase family protein [Ignavibacteria bacterium]